MRANELELLRASGVEPCLLMDNGAETGRLPFSEAALALRPGVNLLDNPDFSIRQRITGTSDEEFLWEGIPILSYLADRWMFATENGSITSKIRFLKGFGVKNESGPNIAIWQRIDRIDQFAGKTITYSLLYDNRLEQNVLTIQNDASGVYQLPQRWIKTGETLRYTKLELGDKQTLAHQDVSGNLVLNDPHPNKALELAKCQRYQWVSSFPMAAIGLALDASTLRVPLSLPVSMRANPEANALNGSFSNFMILNVGRLANITCAFSGSLVELICTCEDASMAPGNVYRLIGYDSDVKLMLDANL